MADVTTDDSTKSKDKLLLDSIRCGKERPAIEYYEKLLADGANPNCMLPSGYYPLHQCLTPLKQPDIELMKLLIHYGADLNSKKESNGATPLGFYCLSSTLTVEACELLISSGADVSVKNTSNRIRLHNLASFQGACILDVLKLIIDKTIDLDVVDSCGCTPLMLFLEEKRGFHNFDSFKLLLRSGCSVNIVIKGINILHRYFGGFDLQFNRSESFNAINDACKIFLDYTNILCIYGADVNFRDNEGRTPLDLLLRSWVFKMWVNSNLEAYINCICSILKFVLLSEEDAWDKHRSNVCGGIECIDLAVSNYLKELHELKKITINDGVTLYDFCNLKDERQFCLYLKDSVLMNKTDLNLKELFPNYFELIHCRINLGFEWLEIFKQIKKISLCCESLRSDNIIILPSSCLSYIVPYLYKKDIMNLLEAAVIK